MASRDTKIYDTYQDALQDCSTKGQYENIELCSMIGEKTKNHKDFLSTKPYLLNGTNIFLVTAIYRFLIDHPPNKVSILDFGGACGAHYFETRRFFPANITFKWYVVETDEMVNSARRNNLENDELSFTNDMATIERPVDFIHSSGALQYVSSYKPYLSQLMKFDAEYLLFNRMMFNENDFDFVTIQKSRMSMNGPGPMPEKYKDKDIYYPHTTVSFKNFDKIIQEKYALDWSFYESSGSYKINNEKIIGKGLLYIKK